MAQTGGGNAQPQYIILPEGAQRAMGRDAQRMNILAGKLVAEAVRSTLGPKGMDKMLVDSLGDVVITNDGVTILEEMDIAHPAAKMIVEVAKVQEDVVGDGTTTAAVIAGELLKRAEFLLDQNLHPTVITRGYKMANEKTQEILQKIATKIDTKDAKLLEQIAMTAMTGKSAERARDDLAKLASQAVLQVAETTNGKTTVDQDNIKIEKKAGGSIDESSLIRGIVVDKERVHPGMAKRVENAKIALVDAALEVKETETDAEIRITSPDQLKAFLSEEESMLKEMVTKIKNSGATVVFCQKGIDDMAQHYLAKAGIFAARRVKKSDMDKLARATGATVVSNLDDLSASDLGFAGVVEEKKVAKEAMTFVEKCKDPKAVTILLRGGTEHVISEVERAMTDAVGDVSAAVEDGKITAGGGAVEVELAKQLRDYAQTIKGREQLAILAFADALEIIPRTLAENSGLDAIDKLVELKSAHESKDKLNFGLDAFSGNVVDMAKLNVIEPLRIKTQAIKSASEAAEMILRIDDVISAKELGKGGAPGGMPPGMGGMGGMGDMD